MAKFDGRGKGFRLKYLHGRLIEDAIRANSSVGEGEGVDRIIKYNGDWSDAKITDWVRPQIDPGLTVEVVRRFRAANIGRLMTGVKPGTKLGPRDGSPLLAELAQQKRQIALLEARLAGLEAHVSSHTGYQAPLLVENGDAEPISNWGYPR